jgi:flagellar basal-body rod protein FlgF
MENALLVGLSRQMTLRRELEVVANNVANVNTSGFKAEQLLFQEHLMPVARADAFPTQDRRLRYVVDPRTVTNLEGGSTERTGNDLDVALQGRGFFAVQTPRGERFTRAGNFHLDAQGRLVTASGDQVMGESGPIVFTADDGAISIGGDGTISTRQGQRGKLRVVQFANEAALTREGGTLFAAGAEARPEPARQARVLQGAIERSNVQPVLEMGRMIEITRAYQTVSQMIERTQDLRRTAIERLAQLP